MLTHRLPTQCRSTQVSTVNPSISSISTHPSPTTARVHARKTFSQLLSLLSGEHTNSTHIILLSGSVTEFRNDTDAYWELSFCESNFFYLTGCHIPGAHLLLSYTRPPAPSA